MTTMPLREAKNKLSELVARVHAQHERVEITVHGQPSAVLVAPEDLDAMQETIDILSDPDTLAALAEAERDIAAGNVSSLDEVAADLRARRQRSA